MENYQISPGQKSTMAWAAILAPAVSVLPGATAKLAGEGAWLAYVAALPVAVLLARGLGLERQGLAQRIMHRLGKIAGRAVLIIYIMWALLLMSARLRLSGQRLLLTAQRDGGLWFFLPVIAAMALWMAWGKPGAFDRTAVLLFRILILALGLVVLLTVAQSRVENLWPVWVQDVPGILRGAVPVVGVLCYGAYAAFLPGGEGDPKHGRTVYCMGLLTLLQLSILGNLGAPLTAGLEDPFLTLSKRVGVEGAFQRVESLVSALWLFADLALLGLLLWACRQIMAEVCPAFRGLWTACVCTGLVLLGAGILFRDAVAARRFEQAVAPVGNLVLGVGVPLLLVLWERGKKEVPPKGHILCPEPPEKADVVGEKAREKTFKKDEKRC